MPNKLSQFWQELKRRNVVRVITVYAASAFVVLELVDILAPSLGLPSWTLNLVLILLLVGFVITVIVSWIYDIHPEGGIVKTEPAYKVKPKDIPKSSNSWKIASYISFVVIVGLIVLNIFGRKGHVRIDESLAKSIAVLPFHNLSGDVEREYICDGLTDEIISHLFKVNSFDKVVSYTSVQSYKDPERNISDIAKELGVNYILEGSYKKMGDELKVTAQLIEPGNDNHIWLHDYELPYNEVPGIPGEIAVQIADHLKAFISDDIKQSIDRKSTENIQAYEIGKQMLFQYRRYFSEGNNRALILELANKAIELDPDYADAYAALGFMSMFRAGFAGDKEIFSVIWDTEQYFKKALELDPYNIMANAGLSWLDYWVRWDYVGMEKFKLKFPNALNSDLNIIYGYQMNALQMGRFEEVLLLLEADSITEYSIKANILLGNTKQAIEQIDRLNYYIRMALPYTGEIFIWLQEFDSALYYLESALQSKDQVMLIPRFQADLAVVYFKIGKVDLARNTIDRLIERSDTTSVGSPAYFTGWYYSWIGEKDTAFYWLEKAIENRSFEMPWLRVDPAFNNLKEDPRYWDLYERTGHKAYDDYMASKNE